MLVTSRLAMVTGAALCVAVAAVHVDDQGGLTAFADPDWLGWAYRLLEVGVLVVAGALMYAARLPGGRGQLVWLAAATAAAGPFVGYLLTRTVGLPQDTADIGNWEPLGFVSLVIEGVLVLLAVARMVQLRSRQSNTPPERHARTA